MSRTTPLHSPMAALPRAWCQWLFLIVTALLLIAATWNVIGAAGYELGDFAANSLLIQDAKSLALFKGNYSRVGFNHPGPAILYVLMAGELVLHDWLHLAPTPFSGQLMAIACYTAFWMMLMWRILTRITGVPMVAMMALCTFAAAAVLLDFQVFTGAWFPHLYFFPFAVMLLAATRLLDGYADTLPSLAVACGFLINGHVSFIAILGIIFLTVAFSNLLLVRRGRLAGPAILSTAFYILHRRALLGAILLLALFLVPLLVETVRHFPGPLADYAAFSSQTSSNRLSQAWKFMSVYWGGTKGAACFVIVCALVLAGPAALRSRLGDAIRAMALVFVGATLALLFYAKVGVDLLDHPYIGLFYYAVPALAAMLVSLLLVRTRWLANASILQGVLAALLAAVVLVHVHKPVDYLPQYSKPEVPQLVDSLKAIPHQGQGRIVLDLDGGKDPGFVWSSMLGVQAYAKRRHADFFCINTFWHISNTKPARCTEDEVAHNPRYRVWQAAAGDSVPLAAGMGLAVERLVIPDMAALGLVTLKDKPSLFQNWVLGSGWSTAEGEFVWNIGKISRLNFYVPPNFTGFVTLDLGAFLPKPEATQIVTVESPGAAAQTRNFSATTERQSVRVPIKANADGVADIILRIDHPISPKQAGLSNDPRILGINLRSFLIEDH